LCLGGGYVLHLDATHEGDAPALMTGLDGLSTIVLATVKAPSESSGHLTPFLRDLQGTYGTPRACVHDMGIGLCKAVAEVFAHTPDFICHFHFLRDIGKDYLEPAYRKLRDRLRSHASNSRLRALVRDARQRLAEQCTQVSGLAKAIHSADPRKDNSLLALACSCALALWVLQGKHSGNGYGFPFDRPLLHFAERLLDLNERLPKILEHRLKLDEDPQLAAGPRSRKMAEQIDKYAGKLFADPIEVDTPTGNVTIYPQRTNNILEQFFRDLRRGQRRKTGNNSMSRMLRTMLADTPLVKNLDNPDYMELFLDGKANLEELFSELGKIPFAPNDASQADIDRILPGFRAIIKLPNLPEQVLRLFTKAQQMAEPN
jgi:hypothetical protein